MAKKNKIEDFGNYIPGARKHQFLRQGVSVEEIKTLLPIEIKELLKPSNYFKESGILLKPEDFLDEEKNKTPLFNLFVKEAFKHGFKSSYQPVIKNIVVAIGEERSLYLKCLKEKSEENLNDKEFKERYERAVKEEVEQFLLQKSAYVAEGLRGYIDLFKSEENFYKHREEYIKGMIDKYHSEEFEIFRKYNQAVNQKQSGENYSIKKIEMYYSPNPLNYLLKDNFDAFSFLNEKMQKKQVANGLFEDARMIYMLSNPTEVAGLVFKDKVLKMDRYDGDYENAAFLITVMGFLNGRKIAPNEYFEKHGLDKGVEKLLNIQKQVNMQSLGRLKERISVEQFENGMGRMNRKLEGYEDSFYDGKRWLFGMTYDLSEADVLYNLESMKLSFQIADRVRDLSVQEQILFNENLYKDFQNDDDINIVKSLSTLLSNRYEPNEFQINNRQDFGSEKGNYTIEKRMFIDNVFNDFSEWFSLGLSKKAINYIATGFESLEERKARLIEKRGENEQSPISIEENTQQATKENYTVIINEKIFEGNKITYQEAFKIAQKTLKNRIEEIGEVFDKRQIDYKHLETKSRRGYNWRQGKDVNEEQVMKQFGITGGEFGNWVSGKERQIILNMIYDSFADMAYTLQIPFEKVGERLASNIAFGSRGKKASFAYYQPQLDVVSLNRLKGAGSLGHELFHALDRKVKNSDKDFIGFVLRDGKEFTFATEDFDPNNPKPFDEKIEVDTKFADLYKGLHALLYREKTESVSEQISLISSERKQELEKLLLTSLREIKGSSMLELQNVMKNLQKEIEKEFKDFPQFLEEGFNRLRENKINSSLFNALTFNDVEDKKKGFFKKGLTSLEAQKKEEGYAEKNNLLLKTIIENEVKINEHLPPNELAKMLGKTLGNIVYCLETHFILKHMESAMIKNQDLFQSGIDDKYYLSPMGKACKQADISMEKNYFFTPEEIFARFGEAYLYHKMKEQDFHNDFLIRKERLNNIYVPAIDLETLAFTQREHSVYPSEKDVMRAMPHFEKFLTNQIGASYTFYNKEELAKKYGIGFGADLKNETLVEKGKDKKLILTTEQVEALEKDKLHRRKIAEGENNATTSFKSSLEVIKEEDPKKYQRIQRNKALVEGLQRQGSLF